MLEIARHELRAPAVRMHDATRSAHADVGQHLQRFFVCAQDVKDDGKVVLLREPELRGEELRLRAVGAAALADAVHSDLAERDDARGLPRERALERAELCGATRVIERSDDLRM